MKIKLFTVILVLSLVLSGCGSQNAYNNDNVSPDEKISETSEPDNNEKSSEETNSDNEKENVKMATDIINESYANKAEWSQEMLVKYFWNDTTRFMNNTYPYENDNKHLNYWWKAHAVDAMMDGYERTGEKRYTDMAETIVKGIIGRNGSLYNEFYDDMEWLALSALRLYDATGNESIKKIVLNLWGDIKNAWWDDELGGMAWKKEDNNRNTCSNGPGSILASRLYERFGNEEDLEYAKKIHAWLNKNMVDPETGIVWDGLAVHEDGTIDVNKNWLLTYGQGTVIGSGVELYRITGDEQYLKDAERTTAAALDKMANFSTGIFKEEGQGDGGLFKGIMIRYMVNLYKINGDEAIKTAINKNADALIRSSYSDGLFGPAWDQRRSLPLDLSTQLSGVFLFEAAAMIN